MELASGAAQGLSGLHRAGGEQQHCASFLAQAMNPINWDLHRKERRIVD